MIGLPRPDLPFLRALPWAGVSFLAVASMALLLLAGGVIGWLLVNAESTQAERLSAIPRAVVPIAAPTPEIVAARTPENTGELVPGVDFAMPLSVAPDSGEEAKKELPKAPPAKTKAPAKALKASTKRQKVAAVPVPPPPRPSPAKRAAPAHPPVTVRPPSVPDPALLEASPTGPLPVIGKDGRQPWKVYARPFTASGKQPRIAIVVSGLGLSSAATEAAIQQLPGAVTLAFAPYAKDLDRWTRLARVAGHEVLLDLPMEPISYPRNDPGPYTLLTLLRPSQNLDRVRTVLSRATGYVGVTNYMGSRFTTSEEALRPVLKELKARGLLFLDTRASSRSLVAKLADEISLPHAVNNRFLDNVASRTAIDSRLSEIERLERRNGVAVAVGFPYPVTIERLVRWAAKIEKQGFVLAPVSAVIGRQGGP
jgi:polysaccharide deacetylase 2 family uncharacterized protein YibQ